MNKWVGMMLLGLIPMGLAHADLKQTEEKTVNAVDHGLKKAGGFVAKGLEKGTDGVVYGAQKTKQGVEKAAHWAGVPPPDSSPAKPANGH